jgi:hypothetical protein
MKNASLLIFAIRDENRMLNITCGKIPILQPRAAKTLISLPFVNPVDIVYITPIPGINIIISDVNKNVYVFIRSPPIYVHFFPVLCYTLTQESGSDKFHIITLFIEPLRGEHRYATYYNR